MNKISIERVAMGGPQAYEEKGDWYFSGVRDDYVRDLLTGPDARILEIGCGQGQTGALALAQNKCGVYCGVEFSVAAAEAASQVLSEVIVGNIEELELPWKDRSFDALIMSEVLEHLVDPWSVLRKLRPLMKSGAQVFASSPNVSHHRVIRALLRGDWTLTDSGPMDRTHLRWFTPKTYRKMFEDAGYRLDLIQGVGKGGRKRRIFNSVTFGVFNYLLIGRIDLRAHCE
ncbi:MAG: methyltransferase domain-containing protein [Acidobacteriota bacterium]|nr:methyltransferase domain-containing protein [Acidobacteriota bacterium]